MRGHPKHRDDADDDCSNDEFDQTVAAQLAQGILGGERARDLRKSRREMKPIDCRNGDHAQAPQALYSYRLGDNNT